MGSKKKKADIQEPTVVETSTEEVEFNKKEVKGEVKMFSMLSQIQEARKNQVRAAFGRNLNVDPFEFDSEVDKTSKGNDVLWILAKVREDVSVTVAETATGQFHAELHKWKGETPELLAKDATGSTKKVILAAVEQGLWSEEEAKEIKTKMDATRAAARKKHNFQKVAYTKVMQPAAE